MLEQTADNEHFSLGSALVKIIKEGRADIFL